MISVIMPVYNAEKYLKVAIDSILAQTFSDFEFLIFNDGSTDKSADIISSYQDQRVVFIDSKENLGYVRHLNVGLKMARGKYIARMDADDISFPQRFEKQVSLLEKQTATGICSSWIIYTDNEELRKFPVESQELIDQLLIENPISHPASMFRNEIIKKHNLFYDEKYMPSEDFKLWSQIGIYSNLHNIPEPLIYYRRHPGQISIQKKIVQDMLVQKVALENLCYSSDLNKEELNLIFNIDLDFKIASSFNLKQLDNILTKIENSSYKSHFSQTAIHKRLFYLWKVNTYGKFSFINIIRTKFFKLLPIKEKAMYLFKYILTK
ncbi:MAG: glycosyltransferase family 2 protein [Opitutaceae bacterium]|nr:glycosyltransferase family 2 protein [Cytophagales bacterium]